MVISGESSDRDAQMKRFRARQVLVADAGERAAAPRLLDADPGQRRVEIVAAIHEPGAGIDALADADGGLLVHGPDRRSEAERVIGRASCRDRVCPSVYLLVVAV